MHTDFGGALRYESYSVIVGSQGRAVSRLQPALTEASVFKRRVDGSFGEDSEAAVRDFRRAAELKVDGVVRPRTREALTPHDATAERQVTPG